MEWSRFKEDDYEDEGDFLSAMEELQKSKREMMIVEEEWNAVWMLKKAQKRRVMNDFQYHALRDVLKTEGDRTKEFIEKYMKLRVQTSRAKVSDAQFSTSNKGSLDIIFMGKES